MTLVIVSNLKESTWLKSVEKILNQLGQLFVSSVWDMPAFLNENMVDIILIDASAIEEDEIKLIEVYRQLQPTAAIIVLTTAPTWRRARDAFRSGATDYVRRPVNGERLSELCRDIRNRHTGTNIQ